MSVQTADGAETAKKTTRIHTEKTSNEFLDSSLVHPRRSAACFKTLNLTTEPTVSSESWCTSDVKDQSFSWHFDCIRFVLCYVKVSSYFQCSAEKRMAVSVLEAVIGYAHAISSRFWSKIRSPAWRTLHDGGLLDTEQVHSFKCVAYPAQSGLLTGDGANCSVIYWKYIWLVLKVARGLRRKRHMKKSTL